MLAAAANVVATLQVEQAAYLRELVANVQQIWALFRQTRRKSVALFPGAAAVEAHLASSNLPYVRWVLNAPIVEQFMLAALLPSASAASTSGGGHDLLSSCAAAARSIKWLIGVLRLASWQHRRHANAVRRALATKNPTPDLATHRDNELGLALTLEGLAALMEQCATIVPPSSMDEVTPASTLIEEVLDSDISGDESASDTGSSSFDEQCDEDDVDPPPSAKYDTTTAAPRAPEGCQATPAVISQLKDILSAMFRKLASCVGQQQARPWARHFSSRAAVLLPDGYKLPLQRAWPILARGVRQDIDCIADGCEELGTKVRKGVLVCC